MLSNQDLVKGLDFTGFATAAAADFNNLVDLSTAKVDTAAEGKSFPIWTVDSALDTPIVPDAASITKWKKYVWIRHPHSTATNTRPIIYVWDDNAVSVATYLKWKQIESDNTDLQTQIDAVVITANNALATANSANANATTAIGQAATALTNANTALALAETANANALQAQAQAADAAGLAGQALDKAIEVEGIANAASLTANAALAAVNRVTRYVKISDTKPKGSNGQISVALTWNKKELNTEDADGGNLVTLDNNEITLLPGTYKVDAYSHGPENGQGTLVLVDVNANIVKLTGTPSFQNNTRTTADIHGLLIVTASIKTFALYHYTTGANFMGEPTNVQYNAVDVSEVYTVIEFDKLSS